MKKMNVCLVSKNLTPKLIQIRTHNESFLMTWGYCLRFIRNYNWTYFYVNSFLFVDATKLSHLLWGFCCFRGKSFNSKFIIFAFGCDPNWYYWESINRLSYEHFIRNVSRTFTLACAFSGDISNRIMQKWKMSVRECSTLFGLSTCCFVCVAFV